MFIDDTQLYIIIDLLPNVQIVDNFLKLTFSTTTVSFVVIPIPHKVVLASI